MKTEYFHLASILDSARFILEITSEGKAALVTNRMLRDAVIRNFEIIGEATKNISETTRQAYPLIPWKSMAGLRDKLIHDYLGINLDLIWNSISIELPRIVEEVDRIIKGSFDDIKQP